MPRPDRDVVLIARGARRHSPDGLWGIDQHGLATPSAHATRRRDTRRHRSSREAALAAHATALPCCVCGGSPHVVRGERSRRPMPLPRRLAKFNRVVTNRVVGPLARYLPGFAVVSHVGRRSGRTYRTPVNLFRRGDDYVIALTYGAGSQWVRNVLAAGGADIETRGRRLHLVDPKVVRDPARSFVPELVRIPLRLANVEEFMLLKRAGAAS